MKSSKFFCVIISSCVNSVLSLHSMLSCQFCKFLCIADNTELFKVYVLLHWYDLIANWPVCTASLIWTDSKLIDFSLVCNASLMWIDCKMIGFSHACTASLIWIDCKLVDFSLVCTASLIWTDSKLTGFSPVCTVLWLVNQWITDSQSWLSLDTTDTDVWPLNKIHSCGPNEQPLWISICSKELTDNFWTCPKFVYMLQWISINLCRYSESLRALVDAMWPPHEPPLQAPADIGQDRMLVYMHVNCFLPVWIYDVWLADLLAFITGIVRDSILISARILATSINPYANWRTACPPAPVLILADKFVSRLGVFP